jgi:hypothetical protein
LRRGDTNPIHKLQNRKTQTTLYSVILRNTNSKSSSNRKRKNEKNELRENRNQPTHQTHLFTVDNRNQIRQVRQMKHVRQMSTSQTSPTNEPKSLDQRCFFFVVFLFFPQDRKGETQIVKTMQHNFVFGILRNTNHTSKISQLEKRKERRENTRKHETDTSGTVDNRDQIRQVRQVGQIRTSQTNQHKSQDIFPFSQKVEDKKWDKRKSDKVMALRVVDPHPTLTQGLE